MIGALVALKWLPARAADEADEVETVDDYDGDLIDDQPIDTLELVAADR